MTSGTKRVFYVTRLAHPIYEEVLSKRPDVRLDKLDETADDGVATAILAQAHAYQIGSARAEIAPGYRADKDFLKRTPNLLIVSTHAAGYDSVDVKACTDMGVLVMNQVGGNKEAVAEHVLGLLLCLTKRIVEADRRTRREPGIDRNVFMGHDAVGRTIGIVGLGNIGTRLAALSRALSMRVLACDPYLSEAEVTARGAEKVELPELMRRADYVSVNCPLTEETRGMIGAREFSLMQPHAYFITTARGHIHDEDALLDALRNEAIAGAGLDVWATEPPPLDHPLLQLDNVIVTPHTAGMTHEARVTIGRIAAEQLIDAFDGKRPPRMVNPQAWPHYARRFARAFGFQPAEPVG